MPKFLGNFRKRIAQLRAIVRLVETSTCFGRQLVQILIRELVIVSRRSWTTRFRVAVNFQRRTPHGNVPAANRRSHYRGIGSGLGVDEIGRVVLNRVDERVQFVNLEAYFDMLPGNSRYQRHR